MAPKDEYTFPEDHGDLGEVTGPSPIESPRQPRYDRHKSLEQSQSRSGPNPEFSIDRNKAQSGSQDHHEYTAPGSYQNLDEIAGLSPVQNPHEQEYFRQEFLEDSRSKSKVRRELRQQAYSLERRQGSNSSTTGGKTVEDEPESLTEVIAPPLVVYQDGMPLASENSPHSSTRQDPIEKSQVRPSPRRERVSRFATQLCTVSYLILFSLLGTLARLGLQTLTLYPGAPVQTGVLWANFTGSVFMGFLSEDSKLFREEWGTDRRNDQKIQSKRNDEEHGKGQSEGKDLEVKLAEWKKNHSKVKKTIPLYIGLATGFCGSLTSFSSFIRDVFFGLSNSLPVPVQHTSSTAINSSPVAPRNGGYDFMALVAIILLTVTLCLGGLQGGAHIAILLEPYTPSIPFYLSRKFIDRTAVVLAFGAWLGTIFMVIWPPDRPGGPDGRGSWLQETWRGEIIFALVFAPLGCLLRFYASLRLNARIASFPLGTFAVNMFGTVALGMLYDLQHAPLGGGMNGGGKLGCQVLQGGMDGFCGCLTTVSTWILELKTLRRRNAYIYGVTSVVVALCFLVIIMGSLRWTIGFSDPVCAT